MNSIEETDCVFPLSYVPERPLMRAPSLPAGNIVPAFFIHEPELMRAWAARRFVPRGSSPGPYAGQQSAPRTCAGGR